MADTKNILIVGVGGQGLVLSTKILGTVAFLDGYDVKTSDVIGLSQRGGKIWGSVRFGALVHSPLIPVGECDLLLGMEKLEALRWSHYMRKGGTVVLNDYEILPNRVLIEKEDYPVNIHPRLSEHCKVTPVNGRELAISAGNEKTLNTVLLGVLSKELPFTAASWERAIIENVPKKTIEMNLKAFQLGRSLGL